MFKIKKIKKKESIKFTNNGELSLFFIGTGHAFSKQNFQNNLLIIKGPDHLLIDCGTLCSLALHQFNTSILDVENFLITHSHADHNGGLEEVLLLNRYVKQSKPNLYLTEQYGKKLWKESLLGGCGYGEKSNGKSLTFEDYVKVIHPEKDKESKRYLYSMKCGNIDISIVRTMHIPDSSTSWKDSALSFGVIIDNRILFTGDTRFDPSLLEEMQEKYKLELILHDCQFFPGGVHAFYDDLKTLPNGTKEKMLLCHYGDNYKEYNAKKDGFLGFAERGVFYNFT